MFYPERESECLQKVWKAAHELSTEMDEEIDLPEICRNIDEWIDCNTFETHRRLSLRTSSTLINGAARLYKNNVSKLLQDTMALDKSIVRRNRPNTNSKDQSVSSVSSVLSEPGATPEQMRRQATRSFETSMSPKGPERSTSSSEETPGPSNSPSLELAMDSNKTTAGSQGTNQSVQTSPTANRSGRVIASSIEDGFDENLPFGYILIHDNYHSRIPSKIIITSMNNDVKKL